MTEPSAPRPLPPEELGFERIVYEKAPPRATITLNRPKVLNALPYVVTIVVLVLVSSGLGRKRLGAPAALGVPYVREER